jgi:hypothetical protein
MNEESNTAMNEESNTAMNEESNTAMNEESNTAMNEESNTAMNEESNTVQDANYTDFIEYDEKYINTIQSYLNGMIQMIQTTNTNNIKILISHIKTLHLSGKKDEIQALTLLFFAISKKYILKSDYVIRSYIDNGTRHITKLKDIYYADSISQASLDYFTLPYEANLLITQNVNFKDTPCNYFFQLINAIMIPYLFTQNPTQSPTAHPGGKSTRRKLIPKKRHQSRIKKQLPKRKTRKNQLSTQYKRHGKRTSKNGFHHERSK